MAQSCAGETKASKHVCFQRVSARSPPPDGGTRTRDMSASREYRNTRMPGSSVRSRTPRLRTASLGVEAWAISTAGCVSMDDMQLLYSCPTRPVAAFYSAMVNLWSFEPDRSAEPSIDCWHAASMPLEGLVAEAQGNRAIHGIAIAANKYRVHRGAMVMFGWSASP